MCKLVFTHYRPILAHIYTDSFVHRHSLHGNLYFGVKLRLFVSVLQHVQQNALYKARMSAQRVAQTLFYAQLYLCALKYAWQLKFLNDTFHEAMSRKVLYFGEEYLFEHLANRKCALYLHFCHI